MIGYGAEKSQVQIKVGPASDLKLSLTVDGFHFQIKTEQGNKRKETAKSTVGFFSHCPYYAPSLTIDKTEDAKSMYRSLFLSK